jgi:hypothetical protein
MSVFCWHTSWLKLLNVDGIIPKYRGKPPGFQTSSHVTT